MINSAGQDDMHKIMNANNLDYFLITKTQGAFLSFDISSIVTSKTEKILLSIFLEDSENTEEISEFVIYPVDRISKKIGITGFAIKTKTRKGSFVDFILPAKFFEGIRNPSGFVIRSSQNNSFVFKGPDKFGTTLDPQLLIVEKDRTNVAERPFNISSKQKSEDQPQLTQFDRIEQLVKTAAVNSERRWYEKPYFTITIGLIFGILSAITHDLLKKFFPSYNRFVSSYPSILPK